LDASAQVRSGIALIILGLSLAALGGGFMKLLADDLSPLLIGWFRFTGFFLIMLPLALRRAGRQALRPPRIGVQALRGLLMLIGNVSFMFGVMGLAYAEAIAILYVYPFLMSLMAPAVLGERVGLVGWLGVSGGFVGVLIVVRPDVGGIDAHALFVLGTGLMVALQMLLNRKLGVMADPAVVSLWGALIAALALSVVAPFFWIPIDAGQAGLLLLLAVCNAASQTTMILALARAEASTLAPFTYTEIISAVLIGLVMFGTLPDALSWAGIGLIILSGVVVARAQGRVTFRRQPKI